MIRQPDWDIHTDRRRFFRKCQEPGERRDNAGLKLSGVEVRQHKAPFAFETVHSGYLAHPTSSRFEMVLLKPSTTLVLGGT
jgi:hypothetical protein